jgi:hypothetical protein
MEDIEGTVLVGKSTAGLSLQGPSVDKGRKLPTVMCVKLQDATDARQPFLRSAVTKAIVTASDLAEKPFSSNATTRHASPGNTFRVTASMMPSLMSMASIWSIALETTMGVHPDESAELLALALQQTTWSCAQQCCLTHL